VNAEESTGLDREVVEHIKQSASDLEKSVDEAVEAGEKLGEIVDELYKRHKPRPDFWEKLDKYSLVRRFVLFISTLLWVAVSLYLFFVLDEPGSKTGLYTTLCTTFGAVLAVYAGGRVVAQVRGGIGK